MIMPKPLTNLDIDLVRTFATIAGLGSFTLDAELKELAGHSEVAWRLMSVPGVGPITVMAFIAAIEDVNRFGRTRDIGAYLGLTEKRYQSAETDIRMAGRQHGAALSL